MDLAGMRLRAQGIAEPRSRSAVEVVTRLGAVQAQDYLGALWAVGLRTVDATEADVEQALAAGSIVRTWPMRGTLHFVAAADARWILELLAPRMLARATGRLRTLGLDEATFARARKALLKPLERAGRLTRPEVYATLERAGVSTAGQRGIHVLFQLAHDRFLCFGPRQGKQHTLVLFDAWLPRSKRLPREEALAELAARYVTGHGPATTTDFAWWSGLSPSDARLALDLARPRVEEHAAGSTRTWLAASPPT
ncbi:MAG TPA: winged helix DNA-binding domain-containing protein, partial [Polyangiaceae bacterium]